MKNLQSVTVLTEIVPFRLFHFSVSPLNSLIFCILNVLILSVSRLHKLSKVTLYNNKGLGAIRAKIDPTSDVDKIFSKMYLQYVLFRNKYS